MRVLSWNVNGIRAAYKKGFEEWLGQCGGDVVCLQEVRALPEQVPPSLLDDPTWKTHFVSAERKGYSGVGLFSKLPIDDVIQLLGVDEFDIEGRFQLAEFGELLIANVYFPNGSGKDRDNSRVPYKLEFYRRLYALLDAQKAAGRPILVLGDFNTAHKEIDLARPKQNRGTSGFLENECAEVDRWIDNGWTDTFRVYEPGPNHYSWWSQRFGVRAKNVGWRIDMILASPGAMPFVKGAFIESQTMGSDHCPIGVDLDGAVLTAGRS